MTTKAHKKVAQPIKEIDLVDDAMSEGVATSIPSSHSKGVTTSVVSSTLPPRTSHDQRKKLEIRLMEFLVKKRKVETHPN